MSTQKASNSIVYIRCGWKSGYDPYWAGFLSIHHPWHETRKPVSYTSCLLPFYCIWLVPSSFLLQISRLMLQKLSLTLQTDAQEELHAGMSSRQKIQWKEHWIGSQKSGLCSWFPMGLGQKSANFFYKGPEMKYFWLSGLFCLCHNYLALLL